MNQYSGHIQCVLYLEHFFFFLLLVLGIYPLGDLSIEEGKPVELFCYLNTSHPDGVGGSWKNLSFWVDNDLVGEPIVTKYNETAIRLRIEEAVVSPKEFYAVTCRQNMVKGICTRYVYVGCGFTSSFIHLVITEIFD